eukprot:s976_g19.t1
MPESSDGSEGTISSQTIPNQLASLVPSFDPSKDELQVYSQKVMLLLDAWPEGKYTELATRLVLNCSGSAFKKLQLHQSEITKNERKSIQRIVELLGGHWGQIDLEQKYEHAERALYKCQQKSDESADSYLARADIMWTELNNRQLKLSDLQAYVPLRGSNLSSEDKKRVLIDADVTDGGSLTIKRVGASIRMLGAGFFHEMTHGKRNVKLKTYDQTALLAESSDVEDTEGSAFFAEAPEDDEALMEALLQEGDEDAAMITDFEQAASDVLQSDPELATAYNAYADARRRLNEKARSRGKDDAVPDARERLRIRMERMSPPKSLTESNPPESAHACFATHGSFGVVDLGATKTVIGSHKVGELINSLEPHIRQQVSRCPCDITFRFGNHGVLHSRQALVVPIHGLLLKVAIVPGSTPFLLSNTLLRALGAVIDTEQKILKATKINRDIPLTLTSKGLFLLDLNDLASRPASHTITSSPATDIQTFLCINRSDEVPKDSIQAVSQAPEHAQDQVLLDQVIGHDAVEITCGTQAPPPVMDFGHLSMADLEETKLDFGQKHLGKTYAQVWEADQRWITWFCQHYEGSRKPAHQKFLHFVSLKVERAELTGETIPVTEPNEMPKKMPCSLMQPKAKSKMPPARSSRVEPWEETEEDPSLFEFIPEIEEPSIQPAAGAAVIPTALEIRVMQMENALARVMDFLEQNHAARENAN